MSADVSLCMIVRNEEKFLENSILSIRDLVDEIIIVDTGSTDRTIEIAKQFTDKIYHFKWIDDFSAARNFAQSKATREYVLPWDADWILQLQYRDSLLNYKENNFDNADVVNCTWDVTLNENGEATSSILTHFFYKRLHYHWISPIHNSLVPNDTTAILKNLTLSHIHISHVKPFGKTEFRKSQTTTILKKQLDTLPKTHQEYLRYLKNYIAELYTANQLDDVIISAQEYLELCTNYNEYTAVVVDLMITSLLRLNRAVEAQKILSPLNQRMSSIRRFNIALGDVELFLGNKEQAKLYYLKALNIIFDDNISPEIAHDPERLETHPKLMLSQLFFDQLDFEMAKKYALWVLENSKISANIQNAQNLLLEVAFITSI